MSSPETGPHKILRFLERIHLIHWIMERAGLWEPFVSGWRGVVSTLLALVVGAIAPSQGIKPIEAFVLALGSFSVVLFLWGRLRPPDAEGSHAVQPIDPLTEAKVRIAELESEVARFKANERFSIKRVTELESNVERLKAIEQAGIERGATQAKEIDELKIRAGNAEAKYDNEADERKKEHRTAGAFWRLKDGAREIRRCWPDTDFNKYPVFRAGWLPVSGSIVPWLSKAEAWHKSFSNQPFGRNVTSEYLNSLDFEELMEFIDSEERRLAGGAVRNTVGSATTAPVLWISRWGCQPDSYTYGLFIQNNGEQASALSISPINLGSHELRSSEFRGVLLRGQTDGFLTCDIVDSNDSRSHSMGSGLAIFIRNIQSNRNGVRLPVPLRLLCEDAHGNLILHRHAISLTANGEDLVIVHVRSEELLTPP